MRPNLLSTLEEQRRTPRMRLQEWDVFSHRGDVQNGSFQGRGVGACGVLQWEAQQVLVATWAAALFLVPHPPPHWAEPSWMYSTRAREQESLGSPPTGSPGWAMLSKCQGKGKKNQSRRKQWCEQKEKPESKEAGIENCRKVSIDTSEVKENIILEKGAFGWI